MVMAGKIFQLREKMALDRIAEKLRDFRKEEPFEHGSTRLKLVTEIQKLMLRAHMLQGIFVQDSVINIHQRGELIPTLITTEAPFIFAENNERILLLILERKLQANRIANQLGEILFITAGRIVEARIPQEVLKHFHEENPESTKLIWFDNVDIPNISKLSLCGPSLADTALYTDYCSHGDIWYMVIKSKKYGTITGLTRNGIVAIFGKVDERAFISYVGDEIFPLIT